MTVPPGCNPGVLAPLDHANGTRFLNAVLARAAEDGCPELVSMLKADPHRRAFLEAVCDLSPFLRDSLLRTPCLLARTGSVADRLGQLAAEITRLPFDPDVTENRLMADLRRLKNEAHVLIALDDLAGRGSAVSVARLSALADACIGAAASFLLLEAHARGKLVLPDPSRPEEGCGWILLAMGKLGACELNFSSDIDLVVFFDPEAPALAKTDDADALFVRMTRQFVRILNDRTEHGYVFRTDLRLRPDPGSTPLAIPAQAALHYYESRGQNWERAAMIKARPAGGDIKAGDAFLRELQPYVWRKYMDFAAIADVHSIKRQIHAHKGHGEVAVLGHNVKLGRGGIREIEFFVQTQQLIAGGRFPELRGRQTVPMLARLADRGWISSETSATLAEQYWFLRDAEHAIQMVADEQTHILPEDEEGLSRIARMRGFAKTDDFTHALRAAFHVVERHYAALFETAPQLSTGIGNLVFTGDVDDPDTLKTLAGLGFERPSDICRVIRIWHFGRYKATQSAEARERLTELTPALLTAFGRTKRADVALLRFDGFLSGLPSGIQLFSLLHSNPALLDLLVTIMGAAPRLAEIITRRPHVFDGLLDPGLMSDLPTRDYLQARLDSFLENVSVHEEVLDRLRIFAAEQKFLIGVRLLTGAIEARRAGLAFSDLADLAIGRALDAVRTELSRRHGHVPGEKIAILGMGKLGSRELTAGSDVDLILLYDHDADAEESDGEKPLPASVWFTRLAQRLIAAVSAPTAEGVLYEIDLRLRPSGNKGPVATHIASFRKYQRTEAWTWEHMALTRARVVAGDEAFAAEIHAEIGEILGLPHDRSKIAADARQMRELIEEEKPARDAFDVKLAPGGLIDIEFIAQTAALFAGPSQAGKAMRTPGTAENLAFLPEPEAARRDDILAAFAFYSTLTQISRLCLNGPFDPRESPPGFTELMLRVTELPDFSVLEAHLKETEQRVRKHFEALLRVARP